MNGFKKVTKTISDINRLIVNVQGEEKTGKTHFALNAPGPIAYFDLDIGSEGVIEKFTEDKEIFSKQYFFDKMTKDKVEKLWEEFKADYRSALSDSKIKTLVIDSGTDVWEFVRLARFGKLTQVMPQHYVSVNSELREMVRDSFKSDKTVIWIHKMKQEFVNKEPTNKMKPTGFAEMPYLVQLNLETFFSEDGALSIRIKSSRHNPNLRDFEFDAETMRFPDIMNLVVGT